MCDEEESEDTLMRQEHAGTIAHDWSALGTYPVKPISIVIAETPSSLCATSVFLHRSASDATT